MKNFFKNLLLAGLSVCLALAALEGVSRFVMPLQYGSRLLALDGTPLPPYNGNELLRPGVSYRVAAQEFDVVVTHTRDGYRGTETVGNPAVIFIGDSFTYGAGLNDAQTIPHIYCGLLAISCVNLGVPGTATAVQLARLERYLTRHNWRPKEVKLLFMGMTGALLAGNDLSGNVEEVAARRGAGARGDRPAAGESAAPGLWAAIVAQRALVLEYSNLARIAYFVGGPLLRARLSPKAAQAQLQQALEITQRQFGVLAELAQHYGFSYSIHIIHPMQDVMTGGHVNTLAALRAIAGTATVDSTAPALLEGGDPQQYYYAMDGHLNPAGAEKIAHFMAHKARGAAGGL